MCTKVAYTPIHFIAYVHVGQIALNLDVTRDEYQGRNKKKSINVPHACDAHIDVKTRKIVYPKNLGRGAQITLFSDRLKMLAI